ncbi:O-antigen ligase family protein [Salinivibrio proteolyticus]|uniref:O-antigen ligase family protein n=1 Tax=Salinivibrio proteolyticus TaxID=334715 RepID=A0ABY7LA62_9GAMM|nr:O-antigen ligase family protein [Salinivibrio proteolyticus]WBA13963.1 O-antigen ligase family protein [Salinivibrio proteolyticus]
MLLTSRQRLTSLLCLIYFTTLLITPDSYKYGAILLAVTALIMLPSTWQALKTRPAMLISGSLVLYFLVTLAFALPGGHYTQLDMPSRVLLAILIFALLLTYPPSLKAILYGCGIGASVAGSIALYQHYILDIRALSTGGFMPIQVAGMAAGLSVFSIFAYIYSCQRRLPTLKAIAFLGITLGFIATLLSGGRGSWVITPFIALWALVYYRKVFSRRDYVAMGASIALIIATALVPALNRAGLVLSDLARYEQVTETPMHPEPVSQPKASSPQDKSQSTKANTTPSSQTSPVAATTPSTPRVGSSSGVRLELWKTALHLFTNNVITGTGYTDFTDKKQALVDKHQVDSIVMRFSRAHNQLLEELQVKGLIGGLTLIVLMAAPWLATKKNNTGDTPDKHFATMMLRSHLILIAGYMLTQHYLNHHSGILFFSLGVVIFASIALRAEARD